MKKITWIATFVAIGLLLNNVSKAQNVVKVNYLSVALSTINVAYETPISDKSTVQLQGYYWLGGSLGDVDYSGYGITPEWRFYPGGEAPQGFFLAPYLRYQNWSIKSTVEGETYDQAEATSTSIGGGVVLGGQWIFGDLITLDVWGGPGYNSYDISYDVGEEGDISPRGEGFTVRFGSTVGIKF